MPPASERQPLILNFIETLENRAWKDNLLFHIIGLC
jgi:hypothetical protein